MAEQSHRRIIGCAVVLLIIVGLAAAGLWWGRRQRQAPPEAPPPHPDAEALEAWQSSNTLLNGSFERWRFPWFHAGTAFWRGDFDVLPGRVFMGETALRVDLTVPPNDIYPLINGAVQEIETDTCPQYLSLSYYVERWDHQAENLNIAVDIELIGDAFGDGHQLSELRYILEGQSAFWLGSNMRTILFPKRPVPTGKWITFERDLYRDFEQQYEMIPGLVTAVRFHFEVRTDRPSSRPLQLLVWGDNFYLGHIPPPGWSLEDLPPEEDGGAAPAESDGAPSPRPPESGELAEGGG